LQVDLLIAQHCPNLLLFQIFKKSVPNSIFATQVTVTFSDGDRKN